MVINSYPKKKWNWKSLNTSKSGTKKRIHSTLIYKTIEEFNNQKQNLQNCSLTKTGNFICISSR